MRVGVYENILEPPENSDNSFVVSVFASRFENNWILMTIRSVYFNMCRNFVEGVVKRKYYFSSSSLEHLVVIIWLSFFFSFFFHNNPKTRLTYYYEGKFIRIHINVLLLVSPTAGHISGTWIHRRENMSVSFCSYSSMDVANLWNYEGFVFTHSHTHTHINVHI